MLEGGESGRVFKSLDERCDACVIQGGDEPPCVNEIMLADERAGGYNCPRRERFGPDDLLCRDLAVLGAHQETAHHFRLLFDTACADRSREDRERLIRLYTRAYVDPVISAHLYPSTSAE